LIVQCAWSTVRIRNSYFASFYWKLKQRRGAKKAIIALARKILVIIYNLLKNGDNYNERKFEMAAQKILESRLKKITNEAKKLGFVLVQNQKADLLANTLK
jgi:hypothetical protein